MPGFDLDRSTVAEASMPAPVGTASLKEGVGLVALTLAVALGHGSTALGVGIVV